jgi:hypothetical protein
MSARPQDPDNESPSIPRERPYRVVVHGLPHFCQKLAALLNGDGWEISFHSHHNAQDLWRLATALRRCDLAYTWGGRIDLGKFLRGARCFGVKRLVMLWSGSDALWAQKDAAAGKMHPWVAAKTHWAVSSWIAKEVQSVGLDCEHVQVSFVRLEPDIRPMPAKFSVLSYVPSADKAELYGWDQIVAAAKALPSTSFKVIGLRGPGILSAPANVEIEGWADNLAPHIRAASVIFRPVQHDGLSFMVLESMAQARHVLYSYPLPGTTHVQDAGAAVRELQRLAGLHEGGGLGLNNQGLEIIGREYSEQHVRRNLLKRWEKIILGCSTPLPGGIHSKQESAASQPVSS